MTLNETGHKTSRKIMEKDKNIRSRGDMELTSKRDDEDNDERHAEVTFNYHSHFILTVVF